MRLHPGCRGFCLTIWQEIDDLVAIEIDQDSAERSATQKRKIVYAKTSNALCWLRWQSHHPANNRHP